MIYRLKDWINNYGILIIGFLNNPTNMIGKTILFFAMHSFAFANNDYNDEKLMHEKKKVTKKDYAIPFIISIIFSMILGEKIFLITALYLILFWSYNSPPLRLKKIPFLDLIINVLCLGLLTYLLANPNPQKREIINFLTIIMYMFYSELLHQLSDFSHDKKNKINSIPQVLTKKGTIIVIKIILKIHIISIILLSLKNKQPYYLLLIIPLLVREKKIKSTNYKFLRKNFWGIQEGILLLMLNIYLIPL